MRPLSGNISDKIRPQSKIYLRTIVDINFGHLKNLKDINLPRAVFLKNSASEKFCH